MDRLQNDERFSQRRLDDLIAAAKGKLSPQQWKQLNKEDFARFLVAREGNVAAALQQLIGAVAWGERVLRVPPELQCELCAQDPTSHSHIPIGTETSEGSTIFYGCPARATQAAVDPIVQHVGRQLEHCFSLGHTGSRWVWCVDYNGFGLKEALQGKLAARFGALFSNHMPERLHKIILLNPPSVFKLLLQAVKPFADQRTLDKLIPVAGSVQAVIQTLRDQHSFPSSALEWLEKALQQKLPNTIPPLPRDARDLLLPSLVSGFSFVDQKTAVTEKETPVRLTGVRALSLLSGYLDAQAQICVTA